MPRQKQTRGECKFCGKSLTKTGMAKHLVTCSLRLETIAKNDQKKTGKSEKIYHLQVQDAWGGHYWLQLEMKGSARLDDLDAYLRSIWLECCGHMSQFSIGGWGGEEIGMSRRIQDIFGPNVELTHIYDFGTESVTSIKQVGMREGKALSKYPIDLMARNDLPEMSCMDCDRPAVFLCQECMYEHGESGLLCEQHAAEHDCEDYGDPFEIVNSPRLGMCGYTGPAEPPY